MSETIHPIFDYCMEYKYLVSIFLGYTKPGRAVPDQKCLYWVLWVLWEIAQMASNLNLSRLARLESTPIIFLPFFQSREKSCLASLELRGQSTHRTQYKHLRSRTAPP